MMYKQTPETVNVEDLSKEPLMLAVLNVLSVIRHIFPLNGSDLILDTQCCRINAVVILIFTMYKYSQISQSSKMHKCNFS